MSQFHQPTPDAPKPVAEMNLVRQVLATYVPPARETLPGAAVVIPLMPIDGDFRILFEVRAKHLVRQPGEVCLPGGHIERGEKPEEAAIREICEELLVERGQIEPLIWLGDLKGPRSRGIAIYAGELRNYSRTFDHSEVDSVFDVSLSWFKRNRPRVFSFDPTAPFEEDFPWELIPGGRNYAFTGPARNIPFYFGSDPLIWGFTANVMKTFMDIVEASA